MLARSCWLWYMSPHFDFCNRSPLFCVPAIRIHHNYDPYVAWLSSCQPFRFAQRSFCAVDCLPKVQSIAITVCTGSRHTLQSCYFIYVPLPFLQIWYQMYPTSQCCTGPQQYTYWSKSFKIYCMGWFSSMELLLAWNVWMAQKAYNDPIVTTVVYILTVG